MKRSARPGVVSTVARRGSARTLVPALAVGMSILALRLLAEEAPGTSRPSPNTAETPEARAIGDGVVVESIRNTQVATPGPLRWSLDGSASPPRLVVEAKSYALDEILFVRFPNTHSRAGPLRLYLAGGDRLGGRAVGGGPEKLRVSNPAIAGEGIEVALERIRSVIVPAGFSDGSHRDREIERRGKLRLTSDRLLLRTRLEPIEGILESIDAAGVRFSADQLGELVFPFDKIRAVHLAQLELPGGSEEGEKSADTTRPDEVSVVAHLTDGSRLSGRLEGARPESIELHHAFLGELSIATDGLLMLSFRGGKCQFLSDLEPVRVRQHRGVLFGRSGAEGESDAPYYSFKRDLNVLGEPLRMGGKAYAKGLGVHAYCLLEYDLGEEFQRFQALAGLDDSARPAPDAPVSAATGSVVFRVYLDGEKRQEFALSYRDDPRRIDLSVAGGKTLGLEVDFGKNDFFMARDRANWAQARIVK